MSNKNPATPHFASPVQGLQAWFRQELGKNLSLEMTGKIIDLACMAGAPWPDALTDQAGQADTLERPPKVSVQVTSVVSIKPPKSKPGAPGFGWKKVDGRLVPREDEAKIMVLIYELFAEHWRIGAVTAELNRRGHKTRQKKAFSDSRIKSYLTDTAAKGAIVDPALWERCNHMLASYHESRPSKRTTRPYSGLVSCVCGKKLYLDTPGKAFRCDKCRNSLRLQELNDYMKGLVQWIIIKRHNLPQNIERKTEILAANKKLHEQVENDLFRAAYAKTQPEDQLHILGRRWISLRVVTLMDFIQRRARHLTEEHIRFDLEDLPIDEQIRLFSNVLVGVTVKDNGFEPEFNLEEMDKFAAVLVTISVKEWGLGPMEYLGIHEYGCYGAGEIEYGAGNDHIRMRIEASLASDLNS